jgi:hypothetical protein
VLDDVEAQHSLKPNRWATISRLGAVGFDDGTQCNSVDDGLHRLQESVTRCGLAVLLKGLIGWHGKGLLLHDQYFTYAQCDRGLVQRSPKSSS